VKTLLENKSTIKEIKERFDDDVERFSNLETAQQTIKAKVETFEKRSF
jgi:tRNA (cmo5U34)-methyltransferase